MSSLTKILFLSASPTDAAALRLDEEMRILDQRIRRGEYRKLFEFRAAPAIRATDLQYELLYNEPDVVHFSGHGTEAGELIFVNESDGGSQPIPAEALAQVFKLCRQVKCVVLNACYSQVLAEEIAKSIPCVVGMSAQVPDQCSLAFTAGFYEALAFGKSVADAFEFGQAQVKLTTPERIGMSDLPQLLVRRDVDANAIFLISAASPSKPVGTTIETQTSGNLPAVGPKRVASAPRAHAQGFSIRRLLESMLPTSSDLEAFCIDHFPNVSRRFSSRMSRLARENLLLQLVDDQDIMDALRQHDPEGLARFAQLPT